MLLVFFFYGDLVITLKFGYKNKTIDNLQKIIFSQQVPNVNMKRHFFSLI